MLKYHVVTECVVLSKDGIPMSALDKADSFVRRRKFVV